MKRLVIGILAHVDSGKTTLSEAMLYQAGTLRKLGRVDHRDAFLDTDALERARGITIFAKQAVLSLPEAQLTLLDTPGHVDFSAEAERALQVMDYAVLVVSSTDGVQSHTETLWRLLERYQVPVFLFLNKMDLAGADKDGCLAELRRRLSDRCVDLSDPDCGEELALCSEELLEAVLEGRAPTREQLAGAIARRQLFPCFFGSALKLEGVAPLLESLQDLTLPPPQREEFGAKIYKVTRDDSGARLSWMKITGGALGVKEELSARPDALRSWQAKADQLRLYNGTKFQLVDTALPGMVVAVAGLSDSYPGEGLGAEPDAAPPALEPVLRYRVLLPQGCDVPTALRCLRELEQEDPLLHVVWDERLGQLHLQLMGEVQLEVLQSLLERRFGLRVEFGEGGILYKETITGRVEGVGHYEPLRHYAEVHLLLEPGERGSGLRVGTACSTDQLDLNWQRLILTHLLEREHLGVLTGSPITDLRITLVAGRAHEKHTEGGDFRQATYRAVRQGLMQAESILLEPWYDFRLELPASCLGRALSDIQRMGGGAAAPESQGEEAVLTGGAPVEGLRDYGTQVAAYTRGQGRLFCTPGGYRPCGDQAGVVSALGYDPERDTDNPADSVFCSHGAGVTVKWDQVRAHMHVDSGLRLGGEEAPPPETPVRPAERGPAGSLEQDKELMAIFERTYGKVEQRAFQPQKKPARTSLDGEKYSIRTQKQGPEYLLVDGYNVIFAWEELERLARQDVAAARGALEDILSNYQGFRRCVVILVFDAYKVKGNPGSVERRNGIYVVYTKEAETADAYIEKTTYEIAREHRVRVVTSDGAEQLIILGHGALRLPAASFRREVEEAEGEISAILARHNRGERSRPVKEALERAAAKERSGPGSGRKR